jgi:VIT1/CCC1 family predicted Fe2+/Mn2+ transporter
MSELTLQDIANQLSGMDKKIDIHFAELKGEIKRVEEKLETKIDGVQCTLEAKIDGPDKRLGNEEIISRTAFAALVVGSLVGLIKYLFFPTGFS